MRMKKVTKLTHRGVRPLNEDKILADERRGVFGVFDGASSLDSYISADGKTGAYIAAGIAADTFARAGKGLRAKAMEANDNIEKAHEKAGIDIRKNINRFGTTAAVIKIGDNKAELLQIGDSVAVVMYKDGHVAVPLGYHDHDLDIMRQWRNHADNGAKSIRNIVADDVIKLRESANSLYGMLNGDEKVAGFIKTMLIDLKDVAAILLLTDGMYIPKADPEADEDWNYYAKLYRQGGLDRIYKTVRDIEKSDPDLVKYPRYKLHDDASGVAIEL
jgi:serine/threonine protein phosphatase PrpC